MSVYNVLNAGIQNKLAAGTALTGALGGTFVYYQQAPEGAALPYVVWNYQGGGPLNLTPSDMREMLVTVQVFAATPAQAGTIDGHVSALLHHGTIAVTGYVTCAVWRESDLASVFNPPSGAPVYSAGAVYRVVLDS